MRSKNSINPQFVLRRRAIFWAVIALALLSLAACSQDGARPDLTAAAEPDAQTQAARLPTASQPVQPSPTASPLPPTHTPLPPTPTPTRPPRPTMPTATPIAPKTPTPAQPWAEVAVQAHCRYGPGVAYLHSADLYPGDRGVIDGRNESSGWLWIQLDGLNRHCWAAASTLHVYGDVSALPVVESKLPYSDLYGPPQNVQTARDGDEVTIAWDALPFTADDDRGYMLQLTLCENGALSTQTYQTNETILTVTDEQSCGGGSGGVLWGVEKHGYTQSVEIPWP
jgi:hypothetical protein